MVVPFKPNLPPVTVGQHFGRLTVVETGLRLGYQLAARCRCNCGGERVTRVQALRDGLTKSCGCLARERGAAVGRASRKHGATREPKPNGQHGHTRTYSTWCGMRRRCDDPKDKRYYCYGARGITVCDRWRGEHGFTNFLADMGEKPARMTIDRIDNDGDYTPDNCRWATVAQQRQSRRAHGEAGVGMRRK